MSPTRILRMEAANGDGPYQGPKVTSDTAIDMARRLGTEGDVTLVQPSPYFDDGLYSPYYSAEYTEKGAIRFGFADDDESLDRWFPKPIQSKMAVEGFEPRALMAVRVLHGTRQVVYYINSEVAA